MWHALITVLTHPTGLVDGSVIFVAQGQPIPPNHYFVKFVTNRHKGAKSLQKSNSESQVTNSEARRPDDIQQSTS